MSDNFEENEWERFKNEKLWPKNDSTSPKVQLFVARDLYAPLLLNHEFSLPTIRWTENWDHNAKEGRLNHVADHMIYYVS